ncbi:hypothetical protein OH77DRAFT_524070 [Trametes cingulata]|nr:hypothetical protein OH77DRAFT_524070 [Trametes cingulata]
MACPARIRQLPLSPARAPRSSLALARAGELPSRARRHRVIREAARQRHRRPGSETTPKGAAARLREGGRSASSVARRECWLPWEAILTGLDWSWHVPALRCAVSRPSGASHDDIVDLSLESEHIECRGSRQ